MFARILELTIAPDRVDEALKALRERLGPKVAAQPGFVHGYWLGDRASGRSLSVTLWASEAEERASRANLQGLLDQMGDLLASRDVRQENLELLHEERGSTSR